MAVTERTRPARRLRVPVVAVGVVIAAVLGVQLLITSDGGTGWRGADGFRPLGDAAAAATVHPARENRPANAGANAYVPTEEELRRFEQARNEHGETVAQADPYLADVTGHYSGTTDEIIQWAAHKWGIPADWLRAQYAVESRWRQEAMGDLREETPSDRARLPAFSCPTATSCYESLGITQLKWRPDGEQGAGTEPLRWRSTAFNADYQAATIRFYYDDPLGRRSAWGDDTYRPGDAWLSLGGWFQPFPWDNAEQRQYVARVKRALAEHPWTRPGF
jgi:hypothetical protein